MKIMEIIEVLSISDEPFCDSPRSLPFLTRFAYVSSQNKDEAGEYLKKYVLLYVHPNLLVFLLGQHSSSVCSDLRDEFKQFYTPNHSAHLFIP